MNFKNFIVAGLIGGIVYFLLGWLFYGTLFIDNFGGNQPSNMLFITMGSFSMAFFISYIYVRWAQISTVATGIKAGAAIGLFQGLIGNFFSNAMVTVPDYKLMALDIVILTFMVALVGATVGFVNGKLK